MSQEIVKFDLDHITELTRKMRNGVISDVENDTKAKVQAAQYIRDEIATYDWAHGQEMRGKMAQLIAQAVRNTENLQAAANRMMSSLVEKLDDPSVTEANITKAERFEGKRNKRGIVREAYTLAERSNKLNREVMATIHEFMKVPELAVHIVEATSDRPSYGAFIKGENVQVNMSKAKDTPGTSPEDDAKELLG